jgi:hypothetical protein
MCDNYTNCEGIFDKFNVMGMHMGGNYALEWIINYIIIHVWFLMASQPTWNHFKESWHQKFFPELLIGC